MSLDLAAQKELEREAQRLGDAPPQDILVWAVERYRPQIALASGFGMQSVAIIHMLHAADLLHSVEVFYLDTDLLFDQTHATRRELERRYDFSCLAVKSAYSLEEQAEEYGPELWQSDPTACCRVRKVEPMRRYLRTKDAWITGIRRQHSATRANVPVVMWDATNGLAKINPMAMMDLETIVAYVKANEVPYNPLFDEGYPSIGCVHCTRPVAAGEGDRAGRWSGHSKTECGIHVDGKLVKESDPPPTP